VTDLLDGWRKMLGLAREGKPEFLIEAMIVPVEEFATEEIDAEGRKIWRQRFRPLPDDADLRREILDTFIDLGRRGNGRRGRKRSIPARDLGLVIGMLPLLMGDGMTRDQAEQWLADAYKTSVGTVQDALRQRKTYAPDVAPSKEVRRLRGKKTR
jgi:hypothetical protein